MKYELERLENQITQLFEKQKQDAREEYKDLQMLRDAVRQIQRVLIREGLLDQESRLEV